MSETGRSQPIWRFRFGCAIDARALVMSLVSKPSAYWPRPITKVPQMLIIDLPESA